MRTIIKLKIFTSLLGFFFLATVAGCAHPKSQVKPAPVAYCHACQCGKDATKCISVCNSPKICAVMCADQCNKKHADVGLSPDLQQEFNDLNARYFGGGLPKTHVYLSNQREYDWLGTTSLCGVKAYCIEIDQPLAPAPREEEWILRHEACHVATYTINEPSHGPAWQQCMMDLADKGAFSGVW